MNGRCYIDGTDIFSRYGILIAKGGHNDFLTFPALVQPESNDWPEEDGIEVDLSNPKLDVKEISVSFYAPKSAEDIFDFIEFISKPGYHTFRIPFLGGREWRLRLNTQNSNKIYAHSATFTLKFFDDFPARKPELSIPAAGKVIIPLSLYEIDGVPLSKYGIVVLKGRDDIFKSPTAKVNVSNKIKTVDGQIYDADLLVFNSKDVTLNCSFVTDNIDKFWECYDAFFNALIKPEERILYVDYASEEYPCYYKKSSGFKILSLSDKVVVEFSLVLTFTVFRVSGTEYLLASEKGELIVTENGEYYIDLKYYAN